YPWFEDRTFERGYRSRLLGADFGADYVCCASVAPNFHIGGRVADIVEAGRREMLCHKSTFVRSLEIEFAVAGVDFVKDTEIGSNCFGKLAVGSSYEGDAAAARFFLHD